MTPAERQALLNRQARHAHPAAAVGGALLTAYYRAGSLEARRPAGMSEELYELAREALRVRRDVIKRELFYARHGRPAPVVGSPG